MRSTSFAVIAQSVEHRLPKPRVAGSSPVYRSNAATAHSWVVVVFIGAHSRPSSPPSRGWGSVVRKYIFVAELAGCGALDFAKEGGKLTYTLEAERIGCLADCLSFRYDNLFSAAYEQARYVLCGRDARDALERLAEPRVSHAQ